MNLNEFIRYGFDEVDLVRSNRVRNQLKILHLSDISEGNGKQIRTSSFYGKQDYTTKNRYGWRHKEPAEKTIRYIKPQLTDLHHIYFFHIH